jgi:excisionase family DNA binding protein
MPEPQLADPKDQQGSNGSAVAPPAGPPAADFGTASPCGGRLYGGPERGVTFGLFRVAGKRREKNLESNPKQSGRFLDNRGMERKSTPLAFFTERTLAAYLAVSDRTIRNWIRRGELASYKLGASRRIDPADVDAFLAKRREEAT